VALPVNRLTIREIKRKTCPSQTGQGEKKRRTFLVFTRQMNEGSIPGGGRARSPKSTKGWLHFGKGETLERADKERDIQTPENLTLIRLLTIERILRVVKEVPQGGN